MQLCQPFFQFLFTVKPSSYQLSFLCLLQKSLFRIPFFIIAKAGGLTAQKITDNGNGGLRRVRKLLCLSKMAGEPVQRLSFTFLFQRLLGIFFFPGGKGAGHKGHYSHDRKGDHIARIVELQGMIGLCKKNS